MKTIHWILNEIGNVSNWVYGISIGVLGKISYEVYMKRSLSLIQWMTVIAMSVFSGYIAATYCNYLGWEAQAQFLVPMATLLGEKTFIYLIANHQAIFDGILRLLKIKK